MSLAVTLAVEGPLDAVVAKQLLREARLEPGPEYITQGKGALDRRLNGYNNAARSSCWLVLRDLDRDAACAPELVARLLRNPAPHMRLNVAVRSVEAWLLADAESFGDFFSVTRARIPSAPELLADAKQAVVDAARASRRRSVREAMVPPAKTSARTGPGYAVLLMQYVASQWRPAAAAEQSASLARLRSFLGSIGPHHASTR